MRLFLLFLFMMPSIIEAQSFSEAYNDFIGRYEYYDEILT